MTLPDKLSDLILLALADLEKVEKLPDYEIDMCWFHCKSSNYPKCLVCFAGAVMAMTLQVPIQENSRPEDFPYTIERKLCALDCARDGDIGTALYYMGIPNSGYEERDVPSYSNQPKAFKHAMRALAAELAEKGL